MAKNWWEQEVKHQNALQEMLDSGIFTHQYQIDALEYAILMIQKEIDGEID